MQVVSRTSCDDTGMTSQAERPDSVAFLHELGSIAYRNAKSLPIELRVLALGRSRRPWDGVTVATIYKGGTKDTYDGSVVAGSWEEFSDMLCAHARCVVPKGEGAWITPAVTINGRCRDQDIAHISQLAFDCDGAGDWHVLRQVLDGSGLAYIVQRSSSHRPEHPKWHVHIPLYRPWAGTKKEWRRIYRYCVGWFSGAADLRVDLVSRPPLFGFDAKTDRLGQPWFLSARRRDEDAVPETVIVHGGALELVDVSV